MGKTSFFFFYPNVMLSCLWSWSSLVWTRLDRKNIWISVVDTENPLKMYDFSAGSVEIHKMKRLVSVGIEREWWDVWQFIVRQSFGFVNLATLTKP